MTIANPKPLRVCFSYSAYAKNLIHLLQYSSNIPVELGLSDDEISAVESSFSFEFPSDLRSILQEGLPVGQGFPNWRSSSKQQLDVLTNLPILGICKEVSRNIYFWIDSWGQRPDNTDRAVKLAKGFLKKSPVLVPVYRHFYIPSKPCMAGNPVFYVHGGEVRLCSFDIVGFFQRVEFRMSTSGRVSESLCSLFAAPAWAAKEARGIEFWTEMADRVGNATTRGGWDLGGCLEEVCGKLRDGGWNEEDIKDMMMMDGNDRFDNNEIDDDDDAPLDKQSVEWHVRVLSARLLRGGWSAEDVVDSLGFPEDAESCFDFYHHRKGCDENSNTLRINNS